jgi:hypothetical protein
MLLVTDMHVHFYPCFNISKSFDYAFSNLKKRAESAHERALMLFLAERSDCHFFKLLKQENVQEILNPLWILNTKEENALIVSSPTHGELFIIAGRQIATKERLEILSLTIDKNIPDGLPIRETLQLVLESGGLAVLNWAPGKWFFKRGDIINELLQEFSPQQLFMGDTTLRCKGWGEPKIMKVGSTNGFRIIAGSDPFPLKGEERLIGTYGLNLMGDFDPSYPISSIKDILLSDNADMVRNGKRTNLWPFVNKMTRYFYGQKKGG